jgi:hypothetical protein
MLPDFYFYRPREFGAQQTAGAWQPMGEPRFMVRAAQAFR